VKSRISAALASVPLLVAACGGAEDGAVVSTIPDATSEFLGACPQTIVFQTDWFPQAEHGGLYHLMGDDYATSKDTGATVGTLVVDGTDTGRRIEIRAGGPYLQSPVVTEMYQDDAITMGYVGTDVAVTRYADAPTIAVFNALNVNPQVVLWNADDHPDATTLDEVSSAVDGIYVFGEPAWMQYFVNQGLVDASSVDSNYQGNLVLATENVAHQGFLTSEPYKYETLETGAIRTGHILLHDLGWNVYAQNLAVRADRLGELRDCLVDLVPVLQQAQIDYIDDPDRANGIIVDAVATLDSYWTQSDEGTAASVEAQRQFGIIGNGDTPTFGDLEDARVRDFLGKIIPIARERGIDVPDLEPGDVATNEFLDPAITYAG
jgi:hypothetical protein